MRANPRLQLSFVLAAIGGGMLVYGLSKWQQLPHYSDEDIATSIELNLSLDLARLGKDHQPSPEQTETLRRGIRTEIDAEVAKDHEVVQSWFIAGAVVMVMALLQFLTQRYVGARRVV